MEQSDPDTSFYFVMHHPVAFRDFWGPKVWTTDAYRHTRYYQYDPALSKSALVLGGRGWGKSKGMEFDIVQPCITLSNTEMLLSSWRRAHVNDRVMTMVDWFRREPFLGSFVPRIRGDVQIQRQPRFEIHFLNGNVFYGASVGDDPLAANIQGPHPKLRFIEEIQFYPEHAYKKFSSTAHEAGTIDRYYGVRDGRRDSPLFDMDNHAEDHPEFKGTRFALGQYVSPYFDEKTDRRKIRELKGEDSSEYQNQVMAEWGEPSYGIWRLRDIHDCMDPGRAMVWATITPQTLQHTPADVALSRLPRPPKEAKLVLLAADPAWSEATSVMCFWLDERDVWHTDWVLELRNKVVADIQARIIALAFREMGARQISIDCSGGDGRAVFNALLDKDHDWHLERRQLVWMDVREKIVIEVEIEEDEYGYAIGVGETREEKVLNKTITDLLQMFQQKKFDIAYSEKVLDEFNSETRKMGATDWKLLVPRDVHVPETFRVLAHALFLRERERAQVDDFGGLGKIEIQPVKTNILRGGRPVGGARHGAKRRFL